MSAAAALRYCLLLYRAALAPCPVSALMPRCRFGVAPYIWPQARSRKMTQSNHHSRLVSTCSHSNRLTVTHGLPCSPPHRPIPASAQKQHHKSVIERSTQSLVASLMLKKKDRVFSADSRQPQRAGPTRARAKLAFNLLGVSSKNCDHHERDATLRPHELAAM